LCVEVDDLKPHILDYSQADISMVRGKQAAADTIMLYDEVANECIKKCIGVRRKIV
jgi:hypothetical protein